MCLIGGLEYVFEVGIMVMVKKRQSCEFLNENGFSQLMVLNICDAYNNCALGFRQRRG